MQKGTLLSRLLPLNTEELRDLKLFLHFSIWRAEKTDWNFCLKKHIATLNNIIKEAGGEAKCTEVNITETVDENTYKGEAILDNGNKVPVAITVNDDQIFVAIIDE